ncbi:hypothetical protein Pelo_18124 [Pelomyxa schiedti]|nr:hypothetical protein Pelo_18124 [Pelomyxa schiedti]
MDVATGSGRHTTIAPIIDARAQFVAFASSWIVERCGACSAAKALSHNRALQIGATITLTLAPPPGSYRRRETVHVFMGVSATLGVAWCTCLGDGDLTSPSGDRCVIRGCVGDDRFVASSLWGPSGVVDRHGNQLAALEGEQTSSLNWRSNGKWLVKLDETASAVKLVVWRMRNGVPVCPNGVAVDGSTCPLTQYGARFSPFDDPCGDELVLAGCRMRPAGQLISFVDLEKSVCAGVMVLSRESILLPHPNPFDLVWSSPSTILTLHRYDSGDDEWSLYNDSSDDGWSVYNRMTGELHTFLSVSYHAPSVSAQHIVWRMKCEAMCEVYHASDVSKPVHQYQINTQENSGSSSNEVYVGGTYTMDMMESPTHNTVSTTLIHDEITGTPLTLLMVEAHH